jgi:hypothetical protein
MTEADFEVTPFWFNPNIEPEREFDLRLETFTTLCKKYKTKPIIEESGFREWQNQIRGLESLPEGGKRCKKCIKFRLTETAKKAKELNFDIFGTTLSVSPHKDAEMINRLGKEVADRYEVEFLEADFKKNDGYEKSIELSKKYDLYRQNYCGCRYSDKNFGNFKSS